MGVFLERRKDKSKSNSVTLSHWTCFTKWFNSEHEKSVKKYKCFWFLTLKLLVSKLFSFLFLNSPFAIRNWNIKCRPPWFIRAAQSRHTAGVCRFVACSFPAAHPSSQIYFIWVWQVLVDWFSFLPEHVSLLDFFLESTDSTSFYNHKESGLIFFCVIRNVLLPVHFESCRRLVPRWILSKPQVASQHGCVCCCQGSHSGSLALHCSYPGDAFIQQISNSTSDSGAVQAMPESSLPLDWSANKRLHQIVISQTGQLREHVWVCNVWALIRCRGWGEGSRKGIPTSFLHTKLSSCSVVLGLFSPHKTFLNGKVGICSYLLLSFTAITK